MSNEKVFSRGYRKYLNILDAKRVFKEGGNVEEFLRKRNESQYNTSEILELSYELQAGSYIANTERDLAFMLGYSKECALIIDKLIRPDSSLLDLGSGEMTTLSHIMNNIKNIPSRIYALDVSWSRLFLGLLYANRIIDGGVDNRLFPLVGDIFELPFMDKSIDVLISNYALYAYHGKLHSILPELYRVAKSKIVLFEPYYEVASAEGKSRMDKLCYIRDLEFEVNSSGGKVVEVITLMNNRNPLTPTACFILEPPEEHVSKPASTGVFSVPGTNFPIEFSDGFYFSDKTGLCFPILRSIPILRLDSAIVASALTD